MSADLKEVNKTKKNSRRNTRPREKQLVERLVQISRVSKVTKGGKKLSFRAIVVIGDENGKVGVGVAKANDVINAFKKEVSFRCLFLLYMLFIAEIFSNFINNHPKKVPINPYLSKCIAFATSLAVTRLILYD